MKDLAGQSDEAKRGKSLTYLHGESATSAASDAGNAYGAASLIAAGAGPQTVGMMSMLTNLVASVLYLKVPSFVERMHSRKKAILIFSFLDAVGWLPLVAILFFFRPVSPLWLIPLWIINLVPGMLVSSARNSWLADLVPDGTKGRYLGIRSAISSASYLGSFYTMSYVLHAMSGNVLTAFAIVFSLAFIGSFSCFLIYTLIFDPAGKMEKNAQFGFREFLGETRTRNLGRFILFVAMLNFAVYLSSPFIASYLLEDLHLSYTLYAVVVSTEFIGRIITVTFWGRYADRAGNLKVLGIVAFIIPFVPLLWLVSPNVGFLVGVQLVSGAAWGGFDLCSYNFIYEAAPHHKRLKYIVYHKALMTLAMALGALTSAYLLGFVRPLFGHKVLSLFLISGVIRFVVVGLMFPKLREVRSAKLYRDRHAGEPAMSLSKVSNPGLFHSPQVWPHFGKPFVKAPVAVAVPSADVALGNGLYGHPYPTPYVTTERRSTSSSKDTAALGKGLYYEKDAGKLDVSVAVAQQAQPEAVALGKGLFYQAQTVGPTVKDSVTVETHAGPAKLGEGLFHRQPEKSVAATIAQEPKSAPVRRGLFNRAREQRAGGWGRLQPEPVRI